MYKDSWDQVNIYWEQGTVTSYKSVHECLCNAKHNTDKKADKFCEEISLLFKEFVVITNKLKKSNPEFTPIESNRGIESLCNCRQHQLQQAIQKFAGIVDQNLSNSGKVKEHLVRRVYCLIFIILKGHAKTIQQIDEGILLPLKASKT